MTAIPDPLIKTRRKVSQLYSLYAQTLFVYTNTVSLLNTNKKKHWSFSNLDYSHNLEILIVPAGTGLSASRSRLQISQQGVNLRDLGAHEAVGLQNHTRQKGSSVAAPGICDFLSENRERCPPYTGAVHRVVLLFE